MTSERRATSGVLIGRLLPDRFVHATLSESRERYLQKWGETCFLLFPISPEHQELTIGLTTTIVSDAQGTAVRPSVDIMSRTQLISSSADVAMLGRSGSIPPSPRVDAGLLTDKLRTRVHFAAPLRKREGSTDGGLGRVTVGRGSANDIVVRHPSVSKAHAWFEVDEFNTFYVSDAGSKNGTKVNGELRKASDRTVLVPGDTLGFGSVEALLCPAVALWDTLHQ